MLRHCFYPQPLLPSRSLEGTRVPVTGGPAGTAWVWSLSRQCSYSRVTHVTLCNVNFTHLHSSSLTNHSPNTLKHNKSRCIWLLCYSLSPSAVTGTSENPNLNGSLYQALQPKSVTQIYSDCHIVMCFHRASPSTCLSRWEPWAQIHQPCRMFKMLMTAGRPFLGYSHNGSMPQFPADFGHFWNVTFAQLGGVGGHYWLAAFIAFIAVIATGNA